MSLVIPYCSLDEAKVFLKGSETWDNAKKADKENALYWGRVYIDTNYVCTNFDKDNPPTEIKFANALLAEDHEQGTLINSGEDVPGSISMKRVKAGSVESETEYRTGTTKGNYQDNVDQLLSQICSKKGNSKFVTRV